MTYTIKDWFANKEHIYDKAFSKSEIKKETEKAVQVSLLCFDYSRHTERVIDKWIPKSVLMNAQEAEEAKAEAEKKAQLFEEKTNTGLKRNQELRQKALDAGIKGIRERMTTETLIRKLKEAGIEA